MASLSERNAETTSPDMEQHLSSERWIVGLDEQNDAPLSLVGGKGYGLRELTNLSKISSPNYFDVPPGFIITTDAWRRIVSTKDPKLTQSEVWKDIYNRIQTLEEESGKRLGDHDNPLFVSARSGAPVSMPGALLSVLNIGINDTTVGALEREVGTENAWRMYFELVSTLGTQTRGVPKETFQDILQTTQSECSNDNELKILQTAVTKAKQRIRDFGYEFPEDPHEQLDLAIKAVSQSWFTRDAQTYRQVHGISDNLGTAIIVQHMVFGNSQKEYAGSGVLLTRNTQTFETTPSVAYIPHAQGLAVVGEEGSHEEQNVDTLPLPDGVKAQLQQLTSVVESRYIRPQDVEFTFDGTRLWILQTRDVPLQPVAYFRFISDRISQGFLTEDDALRLMSTSELQSLLVPPLDPAEVKKTKERNNLLTHGTTISLGNASGRVASTLEKTLLYRDEPVVLVINTMTLFEMAELMDDSKYPNVVGVIAGNGGIGSHIARIATRVGSRMPIIFGADTSMIHEEIVTLDGDTGDIYRGIIPRLTNGKSVHLSTEEFKIATTWYEKKLQNLWRYVTDEEGIAQFETKAMEALKHSTATYQSPKAQVQEVINALIPEAIRSQYVAYKSSDVAHIIDKIDEILARGNHVTVRTCFTPDRQGKAPWVMIASEEQARMFFSDPSFEWKYGGYNVWIQDPDLTELLVGEIPQNKMNEDPIVQHTYASWTVTCTELGDIIMQVRPHTAHLRGHEEAGPDDLITYYLRVDPSDKHTLRASNQIIGANLQNDEQARALASLALENITLWWEKYEIPKRLAALALVFTTPRFATPVLEGQAQLDGKKWCKIYSLKIDLVDDSDELK